MTTEGNNGNGPLSDRGNGHRVSALDRAIMTAIGNGRKVGNDDDPASKTYPEVWRWLTQTNGGGDYVMQPASLSIQLGPEGVLVSLTHRDLGVTCSVACPTLADVLPQLEAALASPNPPIRQWGKTEPVLRRRRSK